MHARQRGAAVGRVEESGPFLPGHSCQTGLQWPEHDTALHTPRVPGETVDPAGQREARAEQPGV